MSIGRTLNSLGKSSPVTYPVIAGVRVAKSISKLWKSEAVSRFISKVINVIRATTRSTYNATMLRNKLNESVAHITWPSGQCTICRHGFHSPSGNLILDFVFYSRPLTNTWLVNLDGTHNNLKCFQVNFS